LTWTRPSPPAGWCAAARSRREDRDGAVADATRALELSPDLAAAYAIRGHVRYQTGELEAALADLDRAIELDSSLAAAWEDRGHVRHEKKDYERALADFRRAVELGGANAILWSGVGQVCQQRSAWREAVAAYDRALALDASEADWWRFRGFCRQKLGRHEDAIADFDRAIELRPGAEVWCNRAISLHELGRDDEALADFGRSVESDAAYANAWKARGVLRHIRQDFPGAVADYTRAIELGDADPGLRVERAVAREGIAYADAARARELIASSVEDLRAALSAAPPDWPSRDRTEQLLRRYEAYLRR
jgi:tetratricopeptide (TPR) repeat protein